MFLRLFTKDTREVEAEVQFVKHFEGLIGGAEGVLNQSLDGGLDETISHLEHTGEFCKVIDVPKKHNIGSKSLLILNLGKIDDFNIANLQRSIINATNETLNLKCTSIATPVIGISSEVGLPIDQAYRTVLQGILAAAMNYARRTEKVPELTELIIFDFDDNKVAYFASLTLTILQELSINLHSSNERDYEIDLLGTSPVRATPYGLQRPHTIYDSSFIPSSSISPVKILFLAANPRNVQPLRLDEEIREIDLAFRQSLFRNQFDIRQQWAVRLMDLQSHFLRHQPNIVHFSGHGSSTGGIVLEDINGQGEIVSAKALGRLFAVLKDEIKCVVLNACYSELQATEIAEHIDCVIGMSVEIGDKAAVSFASAFYQAIGYGRDVHTAFELGCVQIDMTNLSEKDTPKLIANQIDPRKLIFARI